MSKTLSENKINNDEDKKGQTVMLTAGEIDAVGGGDMLADQNATTMALQKQQAEQNLVGASSGSTSAGKGP